MKTFGLDLFCILIFFILIFKHIVYAENDYSLNVNNMEAFEHKLVNPEKI